MFRLTRAVRFSVQPGAQRVPGSVNGFAGEPPTTGIFPFVELRATISGAVSPRTGYLANIREIDRVLRERAVPRFISAGGTELPAVASLLVQCTELCSDGWTPHRLESLAFLPSPFCSLTCTTGPSPMIRFSQKFEFCASHRLHDPSLSDEENRALFGKCNNPHGHGHNYEVQVTLDVDAGAPAAIRVPLLQQIVNRHVIDPFDHRNLNSERPEFAQLNPSVENIAKVIHGLLKAPLAEAGMKLTSVTVWETPKTWCEYAG
jgi:6-pyruvoyltetrahydropterin/6-carboxytetrahydropterin synthase